jgi:TnpA family transposase
MPRRSILSAAEGNILLAFPDNQDDLIRYYTFNDNDLSIIGRHRGDANRLGFAIQLCYMRYPGIMLRFGQEPPSHLLEIVAMQLNIPASSWSGYGKRDKTRREHLVELQATFGFQPFAKQHYQPSLYSLEELALQTDKGIVLAKALVHRLQGQSVLLPSIHVIERICAQAITRAARSIYHLLTESLTKEHQRHLDELLILLEDSPISTWAWLKQPPRATNPKQLLAHISRLRLIESLDLPLGIERQIHQNRLLKLAREGAQMSSQHLRDLESKRRYATLVATLIETKATIIDEIIDLNDRIIGSSFNKAKGKHEETFQQLGKAINENLRLYCQIGKALIGARKDGLDPFAAIESVLPWEDFTASIQEAQKLLQPEDFDYLHRISDSYSQIRRYAPAFLKALRMQASVAAVDILQAIEILKLMNENNSRQVPKNAPISFIRKRWKSLVLTENGIDRRFYELCVLSELKNALRSGDIWVQGSRQFKDFNEYLLPADKFNGLKQAGELPLTVPTSSDEYLHDRLLLLEQQLKTVNRLAKADGLPDAVITKSGLKITPLASSVPKEADILIEQAYKLLPRVKITELLLEVDGWTDFTRHFTHVKSGEMSQDKTWLLTVILADAINLGLIKMAESCPEVTYAKLSWLQSWYIRDETYTAALAELVNAQSKQMFAGNWGHGNTSSSDGQRFKVGGCAKAIGKINPKYGNSPGVLFYTHLSDQYVPFHTKVINVGVRDATYVLDGLLYHESDLKIKEHYTDTAGFTDHLFGMMHLLGFCFAPRIRDLNDKRLFVPGKETDYPALMPLIGGTINQKSIRSHWDEILRLATSIQKGTVTASLMLRKLGSYPRQNGLAVALRELGRIERTLFTLDWFQNTDLRRRVNAGLNKGESRNSLAKAVFFNRLGEVRDRSLESQQYRASGLNLVTAAIALWNTVYLEKAIQAINTV